MNARFRLDARGLLTPDNNEAKEALVSRPGPYYLAPTSPDLLFFVRSPPVGGNIGRPRVVLAGDAGGFPLSDLIAFLSQSRWTGVIRVNAPSGERSLSLKDGEVKGAGSDDPADRLGEIMVRLGYVNRQMLEEVLNEHPP